MKEIKYFSKNPKGFSVDDIQKKSDSFSFTLPNGKKGKIEIILVDEKEKAFKIIFFLENKFYEEIYFLYSIKNIRNEIKKVLKKLGFKDKEEIKKKKLDLDLDLDNNFTFKISNFDFDGNEIAAKGNLYEGNKKLLEELIIYNNEIIIEDSISIKKLEKIVGKMNKILENGKVGVEVDDDEPDEIIISFNKGYDFFSKEKNIKIEK